MEEVVVFSPPSRGTRTIINEDWNASVQEKKCHFLWNGAYIRVYVFQIQAQPSWISLAMEPWYLVGTTPWPAVHIYIYIYTSVAGNRSAWEASVSKAESRGPNLIKPGVLQGVGAWIFISLPADTDRQCESPKCLASDVAAAGTRAPSVPARPPVNLAANGKIDREKKEGSRAVDKGSVLDPCMTKRTGVRARFLFFVHTRWACIRTLSTSHPHILYLYFHSWSEKKKKW